MKMYSIDGKVLIDVQDFRREGNNLVMKGRMMDAMTMSIYLRPEELWQALKLLSLSVIIYLPVMIIRGWWQRLKERRS
ncbi:MAG: hypothetical protein ABSE05_06485 [Syntrophales bacterium]|jgi:hypothetical protein